MAFKINIKQFEKEIKNAREKKLKMIVGALNGVAFDIQKGEQEKIPKWISSPKKFWARSIVVDKATPQREYARIGFLKRADAAMLMEKGGKRKPVRKRIAVPSKNVKKGKKGTITKGMRPKALADKPAYFVARIRGTLAIWRRLKRKIKMFYSLQSFTEYDAGTIEFEKEAAVRAAAAFPNQFSYWLKRIYH